MISGILKNSGSSLLLLVLMLVLPVLGSSGSIWYLIRYESLILEFSIVQWVLFFFLVSFTMAFALTPTTFVALVTGYFAGWSGLYGLVPSYLLASFLGYVLAYTIDKGNFFEEIRKREKVNRLIGNLKKNEFWVIFFCRISPALPFAMMNVFLSFMKVRLKNFIGGSLLGMLPRTVLSVWIGTQATDIIKILRGTEEPDLSKLLAVLLLVLSIVGLYSLVTRALRKYEG